jgi:hypothetical protein
MLEIQTTHKAGPSNSSVSDLTGRSRSIRKHSISSAVVIYLLGSAALLASTELAKAFSSISYSDSRETG